MKKTTLIAGAAALVAAASLPTSDAAACSCAFGFTEFIAPADGAEDVPVNARVWIGGGHWGMGDGNPEGLLRLVNAAGESVETTTTDIRADMDVLAVLTPDDDLEAGMTYLVLDGGGAALTTFTVGQGVDDELPEIPLEVGREASSDPRGPVPPSSCGYSDMVTIDVAGDGLFVVANVDGADGLDTTTISGNASQMTFDDELRIGRAGCTFSWPDAEPTASTDVRFGAFDIAGNFSGWTEPSDVTLPAAGTVSGGTTSSCSAAGEAGPGAFAMLLALFGLGAVRRR